MCTVVNKRKSEYDVYIGRGSVWGNPYPIDDDIGETRSVVIARYRHHLWNMMQSGEVTKKMLLALDGKRLGCYCKPLQCHGDVIQSAVRWAKGE